MSLTFDGVLQIINYAARHNCNAPRTVTAMLPIQDWQTYRKILIGFRGTEEAHLR
jgi:hypothetical protein